MAYTQDDQISELREELGQLQMGPTRPYPKRAGQNQQYDNIMYQLLAQTKIAKSKLDISEQTVIGNEKNSQ